MREISRAITSNMFTFKVLSQLGNIIDYRNDHIVLTSTRRVFFPSAIDGRFLNELDSQSGRE